MKNADAACLNTIRIYIHQGQKVPNTSFWKRFLGGNLLSTALLRRAKAAGLRQAIMLPVKAGFLADTRLVFGVTEINPPDLPVCIEIIDDPGKIRLFITENRNLLASAFAVTENTETFRVVSKPD